MEPLVSVIIPVYNVLPYLREALDSVINQTYKNLEILIVDDGSTDGSGAVCDEYLSDPRVVVIHQENKGLSGARNTGLDRMTGEYVAFLDSDDAFMPEMIEKMLDAMVRNGTFAAMCGYDACYTDNLLNASETRKTTILQFNKEELFSSTKVLNLLITDKLCWAVWNKMYTSSIWKEIRFPEGANYEDMRIMCQVIEDCGQIIAVPNLRVFYRKRIGSITNLQTEKNLQDYLLAIRAIDTYIRKHSIVIFSKENIQFFQELYARILSKRYAQFLLHCTSAQSKQKFRNEIQIRWKQLEGVSCQIQSRITRFLFLYTPALLIPAQFCWRFGKTIFRKAHA